MTRQAGGAGGGDFKPFDGEDDEWYRASIVKPDKGWIQPGAEKYGSKPTLVVELKVKGHKDNARDMLGLTLNSRADGELSKLRRFVNAVAGRDKADECWFDDETLEWGYDLPAMKQPFGQIGLDGLEVMFKGETRKNGAGKPTFRVTAYKPVKVSQ